MTNYKFGDVVLVPFPFTDQTTTKKRPAIIVSSHDYQRERSDLVLIAVTSQSNPVTSFGEMTITEWRAAGLIKPSIIKPVLITISKGLVIKKLGQLEEVDRQARTAKSFTVYFRLMGERLKSSSHAKCARPISDQTRQKLKVKRHS